MGENMTRTMHRPADESTGEPIQEAPLEGAAPKRRRRGWIAAAAAAAAVALAAGALAVIDTNGGTDIRQAGVGSTGDDGNETTDATVASEPAATTGSEPTSEPATAPPSASKCPTAAPNPPGPRVGAVVAGDPSGLLVAGGSDGKGNTPNDTWAFACGAWAKPARAESPAPPFGSRSAAVYDPARGHTLLLASDQSTWTWKDATWTSRRTATKPTRMDDPVMAFDTARQRVLLFGAAMSGGALELWSWDGSAWSKLAAPPASPRFRSAFAFDAARGQAVLFGGQVNFDPKTASADTWTFDGSGWAKAEPANTPAAGAAYAAFDPVRGAVVLLAKDGTWTWDGSDWTKRASAEAGPGSRGGTQLTWDPTTEKVVLFGGKTFDAAVGDLWAWDGQGWAKASSS